MFSKVLVMLNGIFLFCISATSATPHPVNGQPEEAKDITGDIHARANLPYLCEDPFVFVRRECVPANGPMAWQDVCVWHSFATINDLKPGSCPPDTTCLDAPNAAGFPFVTCFPNYQRKNLNGKRKYDPQYGTSETKRGRTDLGNTQQFHAVTIDHDMSGASVSAVFESNDATFIIAPNNVIVGNVHGKKENVCHGDKSNPSKARECYPLGKYDFKAGQIIDFTWGMTSDQEGRLVYGVVPAASV